MQGHSTNTIIDSPMLATLSLGYGLKELISVYTQLNSKQARVLEGKYLI